MPGAKRPGFARVAFDEGFWERDQEAATPAARSAAASWRAEVEDDGVDIRRLRPCDPEGRDGTRLSGCVKVYVPAPAGPWGVVLEVALDAHGAWLDYRAFGLRHPPRESRRLSVYQIAHRRLHPS